MFSDLVKGEYGLAKDKVAFINELREVLFELSPMNKNPVDYVRWVPIEKVKANDYNPNQVADMELRLLHTSITHDGYTQPIVTIHDKEKDEYVIVDGFHRYFVEKTSPDLLEFNKGLLPIVVIDKDINDRMASTIRHNRARGKHKITGLASLVFKMLDNGWTDEQICKELGMEAEEVVKLKHITGFSKLFDNIEYKNAWKAKIQIKKEREYFEKNNITPTNNLP